jgi:hypothetical protein
MSRVLAWFSCGSASAYAAKLAVEKYGDRCEVLYCDTLAYEHPDNRRFLADVEFWIGKPVAILKSAEYADIYDVFQKTRWLIGTEGARCTTELKKNVRKAYQTVEDIHVFGFTVEEGQEGPRNRIKKLREENPEIYAEFPLFERGITKAECHRAIAAAGIEQPVMYRMGYKNNNCIGCVKGGMGYWNKIRRDFPEAFERMAKVERELDAAVCKKEGKNKDGTRWRKRIFLDELKPTDGRYHKEPDIECGVLCTPSG